MINRMGWLAAGVAVCGILAALAAPARADTAADMATVEARTLADILDSVPSTSLVNGYLSSLQADGSWTDVNYADTSATAWNPLNHLNRLRDMVRAYANPSHSLYHNAALLAGVLKAYDYWIADDPQSTNWYQNQIATPTALGQAMLPIQTELGATRMTSGLTVVARSYVARSTNSGTNTGQNRVWRANATILRGLMADSSSVVAEAFGAIADTAIVTTGEGIQRDGSYHQHGPQLYGGGYGMAFSGDQARLGAVAAGTAYDLGDAKKQILVDFLLDGQQLFVRGTVYNYTAMGRELSRKGKGTGALGLINALNDALTFGTYRYDELVTMKARLVADKAAGAAHADTAFVGSKHFWRSDATVHAPEGWYASVKTASNRTYLPEAGNGEALKSLHLADGVTLIMKSGNEYTDIAPVWDWRRLPGTTVEQGTYSLKPTDWGAYGTSTFAGGVSNGTASAAVFDYNRKNVAAQKSWFFFDHEFLALGADIDAPAATASVLTSLNQTLRSGTVTYATTGGGVQTLASGSVTPAGLRWVHHDGVGYIFLEATNAATIQAANQSGTWYDINHQYDSTVVTKDVFSLTLNHGTGFSDGTYAYIVVPDIAAAAMAAYVAANPLTVLRNDATVQAVRNAGQNMVQAAFYAADDLEIADGFTLTPSAACMLILEQTGDQLSISASNPAAAALTLELTTTLELTGPGAVWSESEGLTHLTFSLPSGSLAGSTVTQTFTVVPEPATLALAAIGAAGMLLRRRRRSA